MQPRRRRGFANKRDQNLPQAVYTTVNAVEPVSTIALNVNFESSTTVEVVIPSWLNGVALRVCSCDVTITSTSQTGVIIRLYGLALAGANNYGSEITARSRPFGVSATPTQIRLKNAARVQHAQSVSQVTLMQVGTLVATANITVVGVLWISIKGAI